MKDTFFRLSDEKKSNLINSCIKEFSKNTYNSASLNSIISEAKISKGGLFKYIESKQDLYLFIIQQIMANVIKHQSKNIDLSVTCYFERLYSLLDSGFDYYKKNELEFRAMINALYDLSSPCYEEVLSIRKKLIKTYQMDLLEAIDWSQYKQSKVNILKISEYMIDGYNMAFLKKLDQYDSVKKLEVVMKMDLELIMNTIKNGVRR